MILILLILASVCFLLAMLFAGFAAQEQKIGFIVMFVVFAILGIVCFIPALYQLYFCMK